MNLKLHPGRVFSFEILDDYERSVSSRDSVNGAVLAASSLKSLTRDYNNAGARIHITPGGGRLVFSIGYNMILDAYEENELDNLNKMIHQAVFRSKNWGLVL